MSRDENKNSAIDTLYVCVTRKKTKYEDKQGNSAAFIIKFESDLHNWWLC